MSWSTSLLSRQALADMFTNIIPMDLDSDTWNLALFNNSVTPSKDDTAAAFAYNGATWGTANEVSSSTPWPAGGVALTSKVVSTPSSGVVMFDAADPSSGASATMSGIFGALVYDNTLTTPVAKQGLAAIYFGGTSSVSGGVYTVVLSANGIMRITV